MGEKGVSPIPDHLLLLLYYSLPSSGFVNKFSITVSIAFLLNAYGENAL